MSEDIKVKYKDYLDYVSRCEKRKWLPASPSEEVQEYIDVLTNKKKEENNTTKVIKKTRRKSRKRERNYIAGYWIHLPSLREVKKSK